MNLKEFRKRFNSLKEAGFIPSKRDGPTGIGYTLEIELGIEENNIAEPDLGKIELKAHRANSNSLISLFTFNNKVWDLPPLEAIKKYGSFDKNGRKGLYYTMSLKPNSAGLFLQVTKNKVKIRHIEGEIIATWELEKIATRFQKKLPSLLFISAFAEVRGGKEYFHFYRAQLMQGSSSASLRNQFKEENILVDLRLHDKGTSARNHGTGFRVYESKLPSFFASVEDI